MRLATASSKAMVKQNAAAVQAAPAGLERRVHSEDCGGHANDYLQQKESNLTLILGRSDGAPRMCFEAVPRSQPNERSRGKADTASEEGCTGRVRTG